MPSSCVPPSGEPPISTDICPCNDTEGNICFYNKVQIVSSDLLTNTWHHVAVTVDGTASKIYLDGILKDEGSGFTLVTQDSVRIGQRFSGSGSFEGMLDEYLIFDRVLSAAQIQSLYNAGTPNNTDLASEETVKDDEWTVTVTPTDTTADGVPSTSVAVTILNTGPTITGTDFTVAEETLYSDTINVFDADGDAPTYGVQSDASNGTLTITGNIFSYTPDTDFVGSDTFSLWVSDNGGTNKSIANYNATVTNVNDAPTISPSAITTNEDQAASSTIVANDVDNDTLTYGLSSDASNGTVVVTVTTGAFTYTPDSNYNGSDSFVLWVSDDDGTTSMTGTYNVTVNAVNDAPTDTTVSHHHQ